MMLTHSDVKNDIANIIGKIGKEDFEIARPSQALKISSLYTFPCTVMHAILTMFIYFNISKSMDVIVGFLIVTAFSLAMTLVLYSNSLVYLSIPLKVRASSVILTKLKKTYVTIVMLMLVFNCIAIGAFIMKEDYILAVPITFVLGFFINQIVLGAEISRLGIGVLIEKIIGFGNKSQ